MTNNELPHQLFKARYAFAAAVMAYRLAGRDHDALLDRMRECERAYLDAVITDAAPDLAAAFARQDRDIDRMLNLLATPPEGNA